MNIPFSLAQQIQKNQTLELEIETKKYQAQVLTKLPKLNETTYTVTILFLLEQQELSIYLGQLAHLYLKEKNPSKGFWLPLSALIKGNYGLWSCYALKAKEDSLQNFIVEKRNIEILYVQGQKVYVKGNLQPNEKVVQNGIHRIVPFQEVQLDPDKKF